MGVWGWGFGEQSERACVELHIEDVHRQQVAEYLATHH